jgi:hypothetical protein
MTTVSTELGLLVFIISFFGVYTFLSTLPNFPSQMKFLSIESMGVFTLGIPAIAGTCVVATGIPCAVALGVYAFANLIIAFFSPNTLISLLIITPSTIGIIYIISKLGRGGG